MIKEARGAIKGALMIRIMMLVVMILKRNMMMVKMGMMVLDRDRNGKVGWDRSMKRRIR